MRLFSGHMLLANLVMFLFVHAWKQKSYVAFFGSLPAFKYTVTAVVSDSSFVPAQLFFCQCQFRSLENLTILGGSCESLRHVEPRVFYVDKAKLINNK